MRALPIVLCGALLVSGLLDLRAADWAQFRGPNGLGVSKDTGLPTTWGPTENVLWKVQPPGSGTSQPVVVGDKIYLTCYTGYGVPGAGRGEMDQLKLHLCCLDRATGKVRWTTDIAPTLPEQQSIRDEHGYASATPVVDQERVYCFFGKSGAIAFDLDGKQQWRTDVGSNLNGWGSAASPVLHKDLVIINASVESESLVGLDRKTGKEVSRKKGIKEAWNTPILVPASGGKTELVVAVFRKILGIDPATGDERWSCDTGIDWYMVPSLVAADGVVYVVGGRTGGGLAVRAGGKGDVTKSHRLWTIKKGSNVTSPVLHEGYLYWMHENLGIAYFAEVKTGEIVYEEKLDRVDQVYASAVLADGKVYYFNRTGKGIVVVAKPKFEKLATNDLGRVGTFNSSPAVADGKLYVRSDRFLFCLGTK